MSVHGAGGHHAVEDATLLDPGQCQVETWTEREKGGARVLFHVGSACRAGAFELGLNLDRTRLSGAETFTIAGPQIKWAHPLTETLSAGAVVALNWRGRPSRFEASTLVFPVTWAVSDTVAVHLNIGRDFRRAHETDANRRGGALEWSPVPTWSFVAERFRENHANHQRVGLRYAPSSNVSIDLSHAKGLHGSVPAWWVLGLNWSFDR